VPVADITDRLGVLFSAQPRPDGLTISGGEPFDQPEALWEILRRARELGVRDILAYSGYRAETLLGAYPGLAALLSALVDGPFELGNRTDAAWKGSENQRLVLLDDAFAGRYGAWARTRRRKMQLIGRGDGARLLIGIPRQEDAARLKNPFCGDGEGAQRPWN
jgi:anaerobic ribonucleoside-triphosphate reductase activating protein